MSSVNGGGGGISAQCFQSKLQASPYEFGFPSVPPLTSFHPQLSHRDFGSSRCCTFPNSSEKQLKTILMGEQILTTFDPLTGGLPDLSEQVGSWRLCSTITDKQVHTLTVSRQEVEEVWSFRIALCGSEWAASFASVVCIVSSSKVCIYSLKYAKERDSRNEQCPHMLSPWLPHEGVPGSLKEGDWAFGQWEEMLTICILPAFHFLKLFSLISPRARKMAQWFRTLAVLVQDSGLVPYIHIRCLTTPYNSSSRGSDTPFGSLWPLTCTNTYKQTHA